MLENKEDFKRKKRKEADKAKKNNADGLALER